MRAVMIPNIQLTLKSSYNQILQVLIINFKLLQAPIPESWHLAPFFKLPRTCRVNLTELLEVSEVQHRRNINQEQHQQAQPQTLRWARM
jgi:hypothetical protein